MSVDEGLIGHWKFHGDCKDTSDTHHSYFKGLMSDLRIYDRALTLEEVAALAKSG